MLCQKIKILPVYLIGKTLAVKLIGTPSSPLPASVYYLGWVSLLTDISSEMVASILPVFLYSVLQLPALQVAFMDGLYQSAAAFVRLLAAHFAERWHRVKAVALFGYTLSCVAKILLSFSIAGGFFYVLLSLLLDRLGKGIRTAPRDTLIANQVPTHQLGQAFGAHRSMDAIGALVGPFLASALLSFYFNRYDYLFLISAGFAVLGVLVLLFKVPKAVINHIKTNSQNDTQVQEVLSDTATLVPITVAVVESVSLRQRLQLLSKAPDFMRLAMTAVVLNLFTLSDGLFYLSVQQSLQLPSHTVSLMFGAAACSFTASAYGFGKRADSKGVGVFLVWAYAGLLVMYAAWSVFLWMSTDVTAYLSSYGQYAIAALMTVAVGLFYGATDGVLVAGLAKVCPRQHLTSGLALYTTVLSVAKLASSLLYGYVWQTWGMSTAFTGFTLGLSVSGGCALWFWLRHTPLAVSESQQ
jgi:MFS family permease